MADYLVFAMTKEEKKNKTINTENRMVTINKRETSFQGLITKFENGEDGIYNLIINDKNVLLTPKISITQEDIQSIPPLAELKKGIEQVEKQLKKTTGLKKYLLKKQLIQMRQDQYIIKAAYKPAYCCTNATKNFSAINFCGDITVSNKEIKDNSLISLFNPTHISALLCNYSKLKENCYGNFNTDGYYLMEDLDALIEKTLKNKYPLYFDILVYKIDGKQNAEIQQLLYKKFQIRHSIEYISSLWRKKIPKLIAEEAIKEYLQWYYTYKEKGHWKKCNRCGQIKLAHNLFFSKNTSSKDGFYSICKKCRNEKTKKNNTSKILIVKKIPYQKKEVDKKTDG